MATRIRQTVVTNRKVHKNGSSGKKKKKRRK